MKEVIIGTAGHIDHGKTSLIKALTGRDLDKLKEEKLRGITIENGYSYLNINENKKVAVIDVPGHEKFIKNMITGAESIDLVMLVIAADEGIMPQTIEHFNILKLLGIKEGIIVLTKIDLVDEEFIELIKEDIAELVKDSFLEKAKIVEVDSKSLKGIDNLINEIDILTDEVREKNKEGLFRIPIDRVFTVKGIGTVITGTLLSGRIKIEDEVELFPGNILSKIRGIEVHNNKRDYAVAGERVAINLANVKKEDLKRGLIIGEVGKETSTFIVDCKITMLKSSEKNLENRERVRFYCNGNEIMARVILLDREVLKAGESSNIQLRLESYISLRAFDKGIIRTYSPMDTIAGVDILEPSAKKAKRFKEDYIKELKLKETGTLKDRINQYIANNEKIIMNLKELIDKFNCNEEGILKEINSLKAEKLIIEIEEKTYFSADYLNLLSEKLLNLFNNYYKKEPLKFSMNKEEVKKSLLTIKIKNNLFVKILELLKERKVVDFNETSIWLYDREIILNENQEKIKNEILDRYLKDRFKTEKWEKLLEDYKNKSEAKEIYNYLIDQGVLIYIGDSITYHRDNYNYLKESIINFIEKNGAITLNDLKEITESSRKYLVAIFEHFDREKVTKRIEDKRVLF
ncbi:MAG: selenocysteine-specific translation elongation factor [Sarcina sp.]